jgi:hypothetical protein
MTQKGQFNADQWSDVTNAPAMTAMSVVAADRGGTLRESVSMARAYTEARGAAQTELMRALLGAPPVIDPSDFQPGSDAIQLASERLRRAVELLEQLATPEEVAEYRRFVIELADTVAAAHKEGGFLGIGGRQISEREQVALDAIGQTLGVPPTA